MIQLPFIKITKNLRRGNESQHPIYPYFPPYFSPRDSSIHFTHILFTQRFFTQKLFLHRLFTHILFTKRLFTQKLFLHRLFTHILFTKRLFTQFFSCTYFSPIQSPTEFWKWKKGSTWASKQLRRARAVFFHNSVLLIKVHTSKIGNTLYTEPFWKGRDVLQLNFHIYFFHVRVLLGTRPFP